MRQARQLSSGIRKNKPSMESKMLKRIFMKIKNFFKKKKYDDVRMPSDDYVMPDNHPTNFPLWIPFAENIHKMNRRKEKGLDQFINIFSNRAIQFNYKKHMPSRIKNLGGRRWSCRDCFQRSPLRPRSNQSFISESNTGS